jgi:ABC-type uncharacterized transport system substrate-binding protein
MAERVEVMYSAFLADKILEGAWPGDLAVERAALFERVVNMRAVQAPGISTAQTFLLRADRVVE